MFEMQTSTVWRAWLRRVWIPACMVVLLVIGHVLYVRARGVEECRCACGNSSSSSYRVVAWAYRTGSCRDGCNETLCESMDACRDEEPSGAGCFRPGAWKGATVLVLTYSVSLAILTGYLLLAYWERREMQFKRFSSVRYVRMGPRHEQ